MKTKTLSEAHGLKRQDLDKLVADAGACSCCGVPYSAQNPFAPAARCHPNGKLRAYYWEGILGLACAECGKPVIAVQVAP